MEQREQQANDATQYSILRWRKRALIIWALIGVCALIYVFGFVLNVLAMPMSIIVWCLVFIFTLNPIVDALHKRGVGRLAGTILAFLALFAVLGLIVFILFAPGIGASGQFASLAASLPGYAQGVMDAIINSSDIDLGALG